MGDESDQKEQLTLTLYYVQLENKHIMQVLWIQDSWPKDLKVYMNYQEGQLRQSYL